MSFRATYRRRTYVKKGRTLRTRPVPGLHIERDLRHQGARVIAGIDEVGVGAWAGPLMVGAVVLDPDKRIYKVRDSKLLDAPRREWLAERVKERCVGWSVGMSWPSEIDEFGLSEAQRRAARRAIAGLDLNVDAFVVDGKWNFVGKKAHMVVRGDCESLSVASASVVAKVARDRLMGDLARFFSGYRFDENKGYPSPDHKWALEAMGPSTLHRKLFAPVQRFLDEGVPGRLLTAG